jgi:hypothetical protein
MDPQQRLALEVVYECLQNSGTTDWKGKKIGSFFGSYGEVCCSCHVVLHKVNHACRTGPIYSPRRTRRPASTALPAQVTSFWQTASPTSLVCKVLRRFARWLMTRDKTY